MRAARPPATGPGGWPRCAVPSPATAATSVRRRNRLLERDHGLGVRWRLPRTPRRTRGPPGALVTRGARSPTRHRDRACARADRRQSACGRACRFGVTETGECSARVLMTSSSPSRSPTRRHSQRRPRPRRRLRDRPSAASGSDVPGEHVRSSAVVASWASGRRTDRPRSRSSSNSPASSAIPEYSAQRSADRTTSVPSSSDDRRERQLVGAPRLAREAGHHGRSHAKLGPPLWLQVHGAGGAQGQRPLIGAGRLLPRVARRSRIRLDPCRQRAPRRRPPPPSGGRARGCPGRRLGPELRPRRERHRRDGGGVAVRSAGSRSLRDRLGEQRMPEAVPAARRRGLDHMLLRGVASAVATRSA